MALQILSRLSNAIMRRMMGTITHVSTQDSVAALTFDDGPDPETTPRLLDILAKHQAFATFFMVGEVAQRYPELVQQVAQAGHAIGNHSWDHPSFPAISAGERRTQLRAWAGAVNPYGQRIFRPPYGHQNTASYFDARRLGYQVVTWNIVAQDWLDHEASWMVNKIMTQIKPGSIILFHDALYDAAEEKYTNREPTLAAVDTLLEQLRGQFRFVTIPDLFQRGQPQKQNWSMKGDIAWLNSLKKQEGKTRRYVRSHN